MTAIDVELDPRGQGDDAPWHVKGSRAPVPDEVTLTELEVKGSIPSDLTGRYIRNTPNPRTGWTEHWFLGDGMLHGIEIADGTANWYRNRWVRTPMFENPGADRTTLALNAETLTMDHSVSAANTHIIGHGGKLLALEEGAFPYEVTKELDTVGAWTFDGKLDGPFTAHPKFCPDTGEMLAFSYRQFPPYLTYYRVSPDGKMVQQSEITVGGPTMMHDFAASRNHVIFMDLPIVFDLEEAMKGGMPMHWSDEYPARMGVMPRHGTDADMKWFDIDPCYVFHTLNAHDDGDEVVMYGCRSERIWDESNQIEFDDGADAPAMVPQLTEWRFNMATGHVSETRVDEAGCEFPRVADSVQGYRSKVGYTIGLGGVGQDSDGMTGQVFKWDMQSGTKEVFAFPDGHECGEPVFVPSADASNEDDGYVMCYAYQTQTDTSYLAIIDATDFTAGPIAEIHVPRRIPAGFHGSWIPDAT